MFWSPHYPLLVETNGQKFSASRKPRCFRRHPPDLCIVLLSKNTIIENSCWDNNNRRDFTWLWLEKSKNYIRFSLLILHISFLAHTSPISKATKKNCKKHVSNFRTNKNKFHKNFVKKETTIENSCRHDKNRRDFNLLWLNKNEIVLRCISSDIILYIFWLILSSNDIWDKLYMSDEPPSPERAICCVRSDFPE